MSRSCNNKEVQKLLYAFELGLLNDEDRSLVETHLLQCEECFEKFKQFEDARELILKDDDVRRELFEMTKEDELPTAEQIEDEPIKRGFFNIFPRYVPAAVIALAALAILILQPWKIEISPTQEATAARHNLAIMYFDNLADLDDTDRLAEIATNLLITDLSESPYFKVVSSQRLFDVLKQLGHEDHTGIDIRTASDVASKTHAQWILTGSILRSGTNLIVTSQLINATTGNVEASQRVDGKGDEDIFAIVDRLAAEIRSDLSQRNPEYKFQDKDIAVITSKSQEAYRYYLEGLENRNKYYFREAEASFRKAATLDTTFAMAYYYLSIYADNLPDKILLNSKALKYVNGADYKGRMMIKVQKAFLDGDFEKEKEIFLKIVDKFPDDKELYHKCAEFERRMGNTEAAISQLQKAIQIDPYYRMAYNLMAYAYRDLGDYKKAINTLNQYITIAPNEANPYDSRGDIHIYFNNVEEAIKSYEKAIAVKPDFYPSILKVSRILIVQRHYIEAEKYLKMLTSSAST